MQSKVTLSINDGFVYEIQFLFPCSVPFPCMRFKEGEVLKIETPHADKLIREEVAAWKK